MAHSDINAMNQDLPQVKTVKLLFVDIEEQQQAMFKMAFRMHNTTNYQVIDSSDSNEKPELVIVDGDKPTGLSSWLKAKQDYQGSVVVYFAKSPPPVTAPYLSKPIKFDTLFVSMRNLLQGNGVWVVQAGAGHGATVEQSVQVKHSTEPARHISRANEVVIPRFDPNVGLLGAFRRIVEEQRDTAILVNDKPVLAVFPNIQRVWVAVDSLQLKALCRQETVEIKLKSIPEDSNLQERSNATITSSLWQLALWTANGRLVQPLNPNTVFRLKNWPNLTRLAPLPESMRLSAFLTKTPVSLSVLYKLMPLDMADILNYIAATYLTDYLDVTQQVQEGSTHSESIGHHSSATIASVASKQEQTEVVNPARKPAGGLLSRFMKKLLNK